MSEIFLDIETTGLSFKDNHKIVEIACIETNELVPTKKSFIKLLILNGMFQTKPIIFMDFLQIF